MENSSSACEMTTGMDFHAQRDIAFLERLGESKKAQQGLRKLLAVSAQVAGSGGMNGCKVRFGALTITAEANGGVEVSARVVTETTPSSEEVPPVAEPSRKKKKAKKKKKQQSSDADDVRDDGVPLMVDIAEAPAGAPTVSSDVEVCTTATSDSPLRADALSFGRLESTADEAVPTPPVTPAVQTRTHEAAPSSTGSIGISPELKKTYKDCTKFAESYIERHYKKGSSPYPEGKMGVAQFSFPGDDEAFFLAIPISSDAFRAGSAFGRRLLELWTDTSKPMKDRKIEIGYFLDCADDDG